MAHFMDRRRLAGQRQCLPARTPAVHTALALLALAALAACETVGGPSPPPPLPIDGPIAYTCSDGTQLMVDFENNTARVAVIGGVSMVLPNTGTADAPYYSNGRYGLRGRGATASWEVGRRAPAACRGS